MTKIEAIRKIREEMYQYDYASYAGRGAFDDRWPAFNVDSEDLLEFFADIVEKEFLPAEVLAELMRSSIYDHPMLYWQIKLTDDEDLVEEYDEDEEE